MFILGNTYCDVFSIVTLLFNAFYTAASAVRPFSLNRPVIASCIPSISDHTCKIPSDASVYEDEILTLVGKLKVIWIAVFYFPFLLWTITSLVKEGLDAALSVTHGSSFFCRLFMCLHCDCCTFIMIAIPICVLLWIRPQLTIIHIIFMLMIPVNLALIVAYLSTAY